jgi:hypothetical protein
MIIALAKQGIYAAEAARRAGVSRQRASAIYKKLRDNGIEAPVCTTLFPVKESEQAQP